MNRTLLVTALVACFSIEATAASVEAINNATIQPGGPRSGANGKNFFNVEGTDFGTFSSYGVARFDVSAATSDFDTMFGTGLWVIDSVALSLTQSNAGFTNDGSVAIYFTADDVTSIEPGMSPMAYPFAGDFPDAKLVTSYQFTEVSTGTQEVHALYQRGASNTVGGIVLSSDIEGNGTVTLALVDAASGVAATYAGYSNSTYAGPTLLITAAPIPEPASYAMLLAGLGLVSLVRRRFDRG